MKKVLLILFVFINTITFATPKQHSVLVLNGCKIVLKNAYDFSKPFNIDLVETKHNTFVKRWNNITIFPKVIIKNLPKGRYTLTIFQFCPKCKSIKDETEEISFTYK